MTIPVRLTLPPIALLILLLSLLACSSEPKEKIIIVTATPEPAAVSPPTRPPNTPNTSGFQPTSKFQGSETWNIGPGKTVRHVIRPPIAGILSYEWTSVSDNSALPEMHRPPPSPLDIGFEINSRSGYTQPRRLTSHSSSFPVEQNESVIFRFDNTHSVLAAKIVTLTYTLN